MTDKDTIKILFAGDFSPDIILKKYLTFQLTTQFWGDLIPILYNKDISILNLESPLTFSNNEIKKIGKNFKADLNFIKLVKAGGFDAACLANNHIMDYGKNGLIDTLKICKEYQINTVGAGLNSDLFKHLVVEIRNKKICFINYCENEFSSANLYGYGANPIDCIANYYDIVDAKKQYDFIILIIHGGREYHHIPLPSFKKLCKFFIDAGADAVVGHHPHYYSGYSYYKSKPIFFSLGNLYANSKRKDPQQDLSYLLLLEFGKYSITHKIIGIARQDDVLRLNNAREQSHLLEHINLINRVINNNEELERYWRNQKKEYHHYSNLFQYRKKLIYKLFKRFSILRHTSNYYSLTMQNLIQCESHRELLLRTLIELNQPFEKN